MSKCQVVHGLLQSKSPVGELGLNGHYLMVEKGCFPAKREDVPSQFGNEPIPSQLAKGAFYALSAAI